MATPTPAPGYAATVQPLFTSVDREHMLRALHFDLWKYSDVKEWATRIYDSVHAHRMPPRGSEATAPWPDDKVALFKAWIDGGCQP